MIKNKLIMAFFAGSALLLIVSAIIGLVGLPQEPGGALIIKFDSVSSEAGLLGGAGTFYGVWAVAFFISVLNFVLALEVYKREKFLSYAISSTTLVITLLFLIASINIASIN
jgi:hypothetical protein